MSSAQAAAASIKAHQRIYLIIALKVRPPVMVADQIIAAEPVPRVVTKPQVMVAVLSAGPVPVLPV